MYNSTYVDFENEQNLLLTREVGLVVSAEKQGHQGAFWGYWKCSVAWSDAGLHGCTHTYKTIWNLYTYYTYGAPKL